MSGHKLFEGEFPEPPEFFGPRGYAEFGLKPAILPI